MTPQIIIAAVVAAATFSAGWYFNGLRYQAKEAEYAKQVYESNLESQRIAFRAASANQERVILAQNAATTRLAAIRRDADNSRDALAGLRNASADAMQSARAGHDACLVTADALRVVFDNCATTYRSMAEAATGHANDALTLQQAWPR